MTAQDDREDPKFGAQPAKPGERVPLDADFGPQDAQLPFHDGPNGPVEQEDIVPVEARKPVTEPVGKAPSEVDDATFIADEFDMPERDAAGLVTDGDRSELTQKTMQRRKDEDPLSGEPTPEEPRRDFVADEDEVSLKPVLHEQHNRAGSG